MSDVYGLQKRMQTIQNNDEIADVFGKLVSGGRAGYKAVIEKKKEVERCSSCSKVLEDTEKFCSECGTKVVRQEKK